MGVYNVHTHRRGSFYSTLKRKIWGENRHSSDVAPFSPAFLRKIFTFFWIERPKTRTKLVFTNQQSYDESCDSRVSRQQNDHHTHIKK